jgi:HK97 family phage major capsid protein
MRSIFRYIGLVSAIMLAALTPILMGFHRWMIEEPRQRTSILLRKVKGLSGATPLFHGNDRSFKGGLGFVGSVALSAGLVFATLAIAGALTFGAIYGVPALHAATMVKGSFALANAGGLAVKIEAKEGRIAELQSKVTKAFDAAGKDVDFSQKPALELLGATDSADAVVKLREINAELTKTAKEREELVELKKMEDEARRFATEPVNSPAHPSSEEDDITKRRRVKSFGEVFVASKALKAYREGRANQNYSSEEDVSLKTLMTTSAGFAPQSTRIPGLVIDKATRPIQLLDVIPAGPTDMAAVVYMDETTRTHSAAERSEGGTYAEDAFAYTQRTETVRSIGTSLPVTDEQLEDVAGLQTLIDNRLTFSLRQRLDGQILVGDGNAPNLTGIKNKASIQTQAKSTDSAPDAFFKAMTKVRVTGRALPNLAIAHPTDWQNIRLLRTADGIYIWGSPSEAGPERMWGLNVVQCDADSAGTGYVVDTTFMQYYEKKGAIVEVGFSGTQFVEGKRTLRATLRGTLVIFRAAAICSVTGL